MGKRKAGPPQITDVELRRLTVESTLPHKERSTLLIIAHALYRDTLNIIASYDRLGGYLGLSRRQAINRMQALENLEVIVKIRGGGGRYESGGGRVNAWRLDLDALRDYAAPLNIGDAAFTPKGDTGTREGCNGLPQVVKPDAHDPRNPTPPTNLTNNPPQKTTGGVVRERGGRVRIPEPKIPRFRTTTGTRAERLAELKAQAAIAEERARANPGDLVQFPSEGGD